MRVLFHQHDGNRRFIKPDPASARRDGATRSFSTKSPRRRSAIAGTVKITRLHGGFLIPVTPDIIFQLSQWCFSLVGCKPGADKAVELGQKEVASSMRDPDSAKFRYVRFVQKDEAADGAVVGYVCGQVNAKNAFGAYAGFAPFEMELSMKSKGFFSKGVTYSVFNKQLYSDPGQVNMAEYTKKCGPDQ